MPTVGRYTTNRNLVRSNDSSVRTINPRQGSARYFGGNDAAYRGQIGNVVNTVGNAFMQYGIKSQDRKDKIIVRNKLNAAREELRTYATEVYDSGGLNSLNAYNLISTRIEDIRQRELKGMDNDSQIEYFAATYDQLSQAHLMHAWQFQEGKGRDLDFTSKREENDVYNREVRLNHSNDDVYNNAVKKTIQNTLDMYKGSKSPLDKARDEDKLKAEEAKLYKEFGLDNEIIEIVEAKRGPANVEEKEFYTDKQVQNATDKELAEMDYEKFTEKQRAMIQKKDEESLSWIERNIVHPIYYGAIKPAYEFIKETEQDVERNIAQASLEAQNFMDEKSLRSALDEGRSIPKEMKFATRQAAIEASNLTRARIYAKAQDENSPDSYLDALRYYKEKRDLILPSQRGEVFKMLHDGLKRQKLDSARLQYINDPRPLDTKINEIESNFTSPQIRKNLIQGLKEGESLKKEISKQASDAFIDSELTKIRANPRVYKIPKRATAKEYSTLLGLQNKALKELDGAGAKKGFKTDPVIFGELSSLSNEELRNIDWRKYDGSVTLADQKLLQNRALKNTLDDQFYKMATRRARGIPELNSNSFRQNQFNEKRLADTRYANFMTAFRVRLDKLNPAQKTPENIDKIIDEMLIIKKVPAEGAIRKLFTSDLMYNYEFDFIKDMQRKEEVSEAFIPTEIKDKYKGADKIWKDPSTGHIHVEMGDMIIIINGKTGEENPFRKKK